jgi:hypothetical protein
MYQSHQASGISIDGSILASKSSAGTLEVTPFPFFPALALQPSHLLSEVVEAIK